MNHLQSLAASAMAVLLVACADGEPPTAAPKRVHSVEKVTVRTLESSPEQLQIEAKGMAASGGWTNPALRQMAGANDGRIILEFVATPPDGIVTQALTPVAAVATLPKPDDYKAVVVISDSNRKEAR